MRLLMHCLVAGALCAFAAPASAQIGLMSVMCPTQSQVERFVEILYTPPRQRSGMDVLAQINAQTGGGCVGGAIEIEGTSELTAREVLSRFPIIQSGHPGEARVIKVKARQWADDTHREIYDPPVERYLLYLHGY